MLGGNPDPEEDNGEGTPVNIPIPMRLSILEKVKPHNLNINFEAC